MNAMYVAGVKEAPVYADPALAIDSIYKALENEQGSACDAQPLSEGEFEELTGITDEDALEVFAYYSDPKSVLSDVFVVKPYPSLREEVRAKLIEYRDARAREFENFDIMDAHSIAKNAVIYDQGEYLVLLMLKDNTVAQEQVDVYIPQ